MRSRIVSQLAFLAECDRLKTIMRANTQIHQARRENVAEHSWHVALWALVFAPTAPEGTDVDRAIAMLLIHDLVEIDAGDQPIHISHDQAAHEAAEQRAAERIFGLLPADQSAEFLDLWQEFEAAQTPTARYAKRIDHSHPAFQSLLSPHAPDWHRDVIAQNFSSGRAARLREEWPDCHNAVTRILAKAPAPDTPFMTRIAFLAECDRLKQVERQTLLLDGSRRETSGEHSWHVALFALILTEHAVEQADAATAIRMLLLHDLVEIDAGDTPLHSAHSPPEQKAREQQAADRIYALLPSEEAAPLRALWDEFECNETPTARFAKAMDRAQPPQSNLATGGENWRRFNVSLEQIEHRVGTPIIAGAPAVWAVLHPLIRQHFRSQIKAPASSRT